MDSIKEYKEAEKRVAELQSMDELDVIEEMEHDRLCREMNEFNEKISNFE